MDPESNSTNTKSTAASKSGDSKLINHMIKSIANLLNEIVTESPIKPRKLKMGKLEVTQVI
jgi:hypothetical protein